MEAGQLESPNFPEDYQPNKECIWRVRKLNKYLMNQHRLYRFIKTMKINEEKETSLSSDISYFIQGSFRVPGGTKVPII